ncbi:hypothetical protein, partial [Faecalibacterium sp. An77]|uniref:hypothetical protein n=1 Tax=Faecalibacterium sp. An77 TaxID=1965655 RepID=UPI001302A981
GHRNPEPRSNFHKDIHVRRENWLSARGFPRIADRLGHHQILPFFYTFSGSPSLPRSRPVSARSRRLCLRHDTRQTFSLPLFLKKEAKSAAATASSGKHTEARPADEAARCAWRSGLNFQASFLMRRKFRVPQEDETGSRRWLRSRSAACGRNS